jgi:hypothetical protein
VTNIIFHDKSMLSLVLIAAFFVGASATNAFMDDAFAGNPDNNGNNGCENANPNAKACENNPNTTPETCESCNAQYQERNIACNGNFACLTESYEILKACVSPFADTCFIPQAPTP